MAIKVNFLRHFHDAYSDIKTISDIRLIPIFGSIEDTILAGEYSTTSKEAIKFFYENTHLTDKQVSEIYYDVLPKPKNVKGIGDKINPTSVRQKRKSISDALYRVFGDDFFTVLLTERNYKEVNWRRNIVNHKLGETSRLFSSEAISAIGSYISRSNSSKSTSEPNNIQSQNNSDFVADSVGFNQAIDSVFSLSDCEKELEFLYRYLNPELALVDEKLSPTKLAFLLSIMEGTQSDNIQGNKLDMLGEILGRTRSFSRP